MAQVSIVTHASEGARDAITGWDAGDMVYIPGVGLTVFDGDAWAVSASMDDVGGGGGAGAAVWKGPYPIYGNWWQSIDVGPTGADGGTFTLSWDGVASDPIAWDADAAGVQDALESIPALDGKVACTGDLDGAKVYCVVDQSLRPAFDLLPDGTLLTSGGEPVESWPVVVEEGDPGTPFIGIEGPTLATGDMLEDVFVHRHETFPSGTKIEIRLDLTGSDTWDAPNDGNWGLDDAQDDITGGIVSGWSGYDPGYANLVSDAEREIWYDDGFYRQVPLITLAPATFYVSILANGAGSGGFAEFYFKVATPVAP